MGTDNGRRWDNSPARFAANLPSAIDFNPEVLAEKDRLKRQYAALIEQLERLVDNYGPEEGQMRVDLQQIIDEANINDDVDMAKKKAYP